MSSGKFDMVALAAEALSMAGEAGAFLVVGEEKPNVMTMGWGTAGVMWSKPVLMAPVRHSRYTHALLENNDTFVVSVPAAGEMRDALRICGTRSGRDMDKVTAAGLRMGSAKEVRTPVVEGCAIHVECRVLQRSELDFTTLDGEDLARFYGNDAEGGDTHSLYFAQILACYRA